MKLENDIQKIQTTDDEVIVLTVKVDGLSKEETHARIHDSQDIVADIEKCTGKKVITIPSTVSLEVIPDAVLRDGSVIVVSCDIGDVLSKQAQDFMKNIKRHLADIFKDNKIVVLKKGAVDITIDNSGDYE